MELVQIRMCDIPAEYRKSEFYRMLVNDDNDNEVVEVPLTCMRVSVTVSNFHDILTMHHYWHFDDIHANLYTFILENPDKIVEYLIENPCGIMNIATYADVVCGLLIGGGILTIKAIIVGIFNDDFSNMIDPIFKSVLMTLRDGVKRHLILNFDSHLSLFEEMAEHELISDVRHTTLYLDLMTVDLIDYIKDVNYTISKNGIRIRHAWTRKNTVKSLLSQAVKGMDMKFKMAYTFVALDEHHKEWGTGVGVREYSMYEFFILSVQFTFMYIDHFNDEYFIESGGAECLCIEYVEEIFEDAGERISMDTLFSLFNGKLLTIPGENVADLNNKALCLGSIIWILTYVDDAYYRERILDYMHMETGVTVELIDMSLDKYTCHDNAMIRILHNYSLAANFNDEE